MKKTIRIETERVERTGDYLIVVRQGRTPLESALCSEAQVVEARAKIIDRYTRGDWDTVTATAIPAAAELRRAS